MEGAFLRNEPLSPDNMLNLRFISRFVPDPDPAAEDKDVSLAASGVAFFSSEAVPVLVTLGFYCSGLSVLSMLATCI